MSGDARLFDLGYRAYDGPRERPAYAVASLAVFTVRRVLGLGRGARHKVLPAITLAIAYLPALGSVAFAVIVNDIAAGDLIGYGDYMFIIGSALGLYFSCLLLPATYLATEQGQKLMRGLSGTNSVSAFRGVCAVAVLFLATSTAFVLWYTYLFLRD